MNLEQKVKIKYALNSADAAIAALLERDDDCRGDEDCDHCLAVSAQKDIKEAIEGITL